MKPKFSKFSIYTFLCSTLLFAACEKEEVAAPIVPGGAIISAKASSIQANASASNQPHDTMKNSISNIR